MKERITTNKMTCFKLLPFFSFSSVSESGVSDVACPTSHKKKSRASGGG